MIYIVLLWWGEAVACPNICQVADVVVAQRVSIIAQNIDGSARGQEEAGQGWWWRS